MELSELMDPVALCCSDVFNSGSPSAFSGTLIAGSVNKLDNYTSYLNSLG